MLKAPTAPAPCRPLCKGSASYCVNKRIQLKVACEASYADGKEEVVSACPKASRGLTRRSLLLNSRFLYIGAGAMLLAADLHRKPASAAEPAERSRNPTVGDAADVSLEDNTLINPSELSIYQLYLFKDGPNGEPIFYELDGKGKVRPSLGPEQTSKNGLLPGKVPGDFAARCCNGSGD